jgi:hypothetical protein
MGDIPKPDPSILLKNIFHEPNNPSSSSSNTSMAQTNPSPTPSSSSYSSNKRTLESLPEEPFNSGEIKRARSDGAQQQQDQVDPSAPGHDGDDDDDDSLVDAHLLSAAVVRRPFT